MRVRAGFAALTLAMLVIVTSCGDDSTTSTDSTDTDSTEAGPTTTGTSGDRASVETLPGSSWVLESWQSGSEVEPAVDESSSTLVFGTDES